VEEAYRRKCVQLKNRTNEVEEANDAARLRLSRIKRQVEKLRIERAFLLEQLAKRTSTNVEDSDGSPSPPPTEHHHAETYRNLLNEADANSRKPKDKPLRIKRGHRKSAPGDPEAKEQSPSVARRGSQSPRPEADDAATWDRVMDRVISKGGFEIYSKATRPELEEKARDQDDVNIDEELARGWKELSEADKDKYIAEYKASTGGEDRADSEKRTAATPAKEEGSKGDGQEKEGEEGADKEEKPSKSEPRDEDVEMKDNDAEERETPVDKTRGDD